MTTLPKTPAVSYPDIAPRLGTGDLVFLHGTSDAGVMIEKLETGLDWPPYSHVGMVIRDGDELYLWDAPGGGDCYPDPYVSDPDNRLHGQDATHPGCRVADLETVLTYYASRTDVAGVWIRQLRPAVSPDRFQALRLFINRVDGLPFPEGPGSAGGTAEVTGIGMNYLAGQERASALFGTYFCAQLVADSYMHMGLLDHDVYPPNGYSPATFGMDDHERLRLVGPATLGETVFVTMPS